MNQKFLTGIETSGNLTVDSQSAVNETVFDVQGTQGQLFSVTNGLSGDLFSVSDISGIPIFNVNSSGLVTIDGALDSFNVTEFIKHEGDTGTSIQFLTGQMILKNSGGKYINLHSNGIIYFDASGYTFNTGDATFAGDIASTGLTVDYTGNRTGDAGILVTNDASDWGIKVDKDGTDDYGILSQTDGENAIVVRNAAGTTNIQLQGDGDATFAGVIKGPDGSGSAPTYSFSGRTDTGMWAEAHSSNDRIMFNVDGTNRAYIDSNGITTGGNSYASGFRNYSGVWAGTTGTAGNGFYFLNTAGGNTTRAMYLSPSGNVTFEGSLNVGAGPSRFTDQQNAGSRLELYNNRQDAGNVEVYRIAAYNSAEVAGVHFYRGSGGSSGYTKIFAKKNNASSLEEVVQFGTNDALTTTFAGDITINKEDPTLILESNRTSVSGSEILGQVDFKTNEGSFAGGSATSARIKVIESEYAATTMSFWTSTNPDDALVNQLEIGPTGNATFAGKVKGATFNSIENAASGGFPTSKDYLLAGTGARGGGLIINDISGARHAIAAGGYDLTFSKETDNGSGTLGQDIWMRANATDAAGDVTSLEFFKPTNFSGISTFAGTVTINGAGSGSSGSLNLVSSDSFIRLNSTGGTTDKQKWDVRAVSASGYEALDFRTVNDANNSFSTKLSIAHGGNATFAGTVTATHFYGDGSNLTSVDADTLDTYQLAGSSSISTVIFNNKGQVHDTNQNFDTAVTPGFNYMRKGTNGPTNTEGHQWYGFMSGLGSDYGTSTGSSGHYANQLYWNRYSQGSNAYLWTRDMEGGSWASWRKMSAGDSDKLGGNLPSAFAPSSVVNQTDFVSALNGGTFAGAVTGTSFSATGGFLNGSNGGIRIHTSGTKFFNVTAANSARDNIMDVGASDARFKDAYFGGTVSANAFTGDGSNLTGVTVSNADTVDNLHASAFLQVGGSWNGANMPGSRHAGIAVNGGEIVFQRDNPNNSQMSILVDGAFYAGENNGFYSLSSGNSYNNRKGFYADTSGILQFNAAATFEGTVSAPYGRFTSTGDASVGSTAHAFQAGTTSSTNIIIDNNEIMARNNGATSALNLNPDGNTVTFHSNGNLSSISDNGNATFAGSITSGSDIYIPVGEALFFGASEHTYIIEDVDDRLRFFTGGTEFMRFTEGTSDTVDIYKNTTFAGNVTASSGTGHFSIVNSSAYQLNGTYIVDSSRNLVNISKLRFGSSDAVIDTASATSATATTIVASVTHSVYNAAFFDFVIKNGTNVRAGTVYACHNGATTPLVEFAETSTVDLGDTSDVTLSVVISGANMSLQATTTSSTWTIKSLIRVI